MCGNQRDGFQIGEGFISVMIADIISEHEIFSVIVLLKLRHFREIENAGFIFGENYDIILEIITKIFIRGIKMLIYYIRHGDPVYDPDELTPLGRRQAEAVAKRLALHGIDEIYSSPSGRAIETAKPLSELIKKPITTLDWCNESLAWRDFTVMQEDGKKRWMFDIKSVVDKFRDSSVLNLRNEWYKDPFFEEKIGKGVLRVNNEVDKFMANFGYVHDREKGFYTSQAENSKRIAIFAHYGFSMIFFSSLLDIPYPIFSSHFEISHSCVSVVKFDDTHKCGEVVPKLLQYSNDSHLYKENLPTRYHNEFFV